MKKVKKFLLYILPILLLASCAKDDLSVTTSKDEGGGEVKTSFSLKVSGAGAVTTRSSASAVDTSKISNVWVLQFTYSADGTGALMGTPQYLDGSTDFDPSNMEVKLKAGSCNLYFVANTFNAGIFNSANCATESAFKNLSQAFTKDTLMQGQLVNTNNRVPMTGVLTNKTVTVTSALATTVNMQRSAALVSIHYKVDFPVGQSFTVEGIRVCNVPNFNYYAEPDQAKFSSVVTDQSKYYDYPIEEITTPNTAQEGEFQFYLPDNLCGASADGNTDMYKKAGLSGKFCTYIELRGTTGDGRRALYRFYPGSNDVTDYNVKRNNVYSLNVTLNGVSTYDYRITSGQIMTSEANCYMVLPGQTILIPVSRVNTYATSLNQAKPILSGTRWTTNLLWTESSSGMNANGCIESLKSDLSGGYIWVKAGKSTGNSLICVKNPAGTILWSWHIWVTDYQPSLPMGGTTYNYNGKTWMDRNVGATSETGGTAIGLMYEFGRKDPFPGGDGTTGTAVRKIYDALGTQLVDGSTGIKSAGGPVAVATSVAAPMTYYGGDGNADWCNSSGWTIFWGGNDWTLVPQSSKALYDPCPPGWRVPPFVSGTSPLNGLTAANGSFSRVAGIGYADWRLMGAGYFPAGGYRNSSTSVLSKVGTEVGNWSASTSIPTSNVWQGVLMSVLDDGTVNVNRYNIGTAYGLAVRCIKE
ncbi:MAG: hypothetical protein H6Q12_67 [Bacteroidetes bacterium]|nr:hypothetical protein [Bacteroidota bacterium]